MFGKGEATGYNTSKGRFNFSLENPLLEDNQLILYRKGQIWWALDSPKFASMLKIDRRPHVLYPGEVIQLGQSASILAKEVVEKKNAKNMGGIRWVDKLSKDGTSGEDPQIKLLFNEAVDLKEF